MAPRDRERYEAHQAELLDALRNPATPPDGFDATDLAAASDSLIRKRARQVAAGWPALAHALGDDYLRTFEQFARSTPPPALGEGLADGFAFASALPDLEPTDEVRAELLLARAIFKLRRCTATPRRGPYIAIARLRDPNRILVVTRVPTIGRYHAAIRLPGSRS
jgi:hypothetical protein